MRKGTGSGELEKERAREGLTKIRLSAQETRDMPDITARNSGAGLSE